MKVIILSSSPRRKGNSEILCEQFAKGAKEAGHEVEMVNLNDYHMGFCLACEYCRYHNHVCVLKDDANQIIEKIIEADVFVMATPVYFYSLSGQLKTLIDRMFAREYEIRDSEKHKKAYLILTSGSPDVKQMTGIVESFRGFIQVLRKVEEGGIIYGLGAFHKGDALEHPAYKEAYEMGKKI
ncbi:MAG: flavodoxin family protein [Beduini sp.]|uniref:flavodoxin family protein n=1 Tax=Beduini sp. TaxID=1922300 RepID=UPI0039909548